MKDPMDMTKERIRSTIVVIPAYQPAQRLVALAEEITRRGYRLIVVDDGSGQGTAPVWSALGSMKRIRVLHHEYNRGKGAAIKTALAFLEEGDLGAETIVTMDADGQHLVSDMEQVARAAWKAPDHLILGSRTLAKEIPWRSWMGNTITRAIFRLVSGVPVYDTQTGLRAFGRALLPRMLQIPGDRYEYEMNVLLQLGKDGVNLEEVPIRTVYLDASNSCSHFDTVKDSWRIYRSIFRFAGASFRREGKREQAAEDLRPYLGQAASDTLAMAYLIQAGKKA